MTYNTTVGKSLKLVHIVFAMLDWVGIGIWCLTPLSKIFQLYTMAVNLIGGGNRSTRRKPPTCPKTLTNCHIMLYRVHLAMSGICTHNVCGDRN